MKLSIRTKFTLGMVFIFIIILILSIFSAFYLNKMSNKTSAILKENYLSVVYAREMTDGLMTINQEITTGYLTNRNPDSQIIQKQLAVVDISLQLEKGNITEPGEDKLVADIESNLIEYRDSVMKFMDMSQSGTKILYFQNKIGLLSHQLVLLSEMNGKAIEVKTDDAKASAKKATTQMTILGSVCFLIAFSFIYSFASYFNERFSQLFNGIKGIVANNYGQRLNFDGTDEFYEISLVFNEMAEKLHEGNQKKHVPLTEVFEDEPITDDLWELKTILARIKSIEKQAEDVISKIENKD